MPNYFKIGQGDQWLRPVSATCDFRISHGTANSAHCTSPAALPCTQPYLVRALCFIYALEKGIVVEDSPANGSKEASPEDVAKACACFWFLQSVPKQSV